MSGNLFMMLYSASGTAILMWLKYAGHVSGAEVDTIINIGFLAVGLWLATWVNEDLLQKKGD